jgi:hypothetical protein
MRSRMMTKATAANATEHELLAACRVGDDAAIDRLIDIHMPTGVATARRLATSEMANAEVLDIVHDAFVTAFDETLEDDSDNMGLIFHRLVRLFVDRDADFARADDVRVTAAELRELHDDLERELRVMVAIHADSPKARSLSRSVLAEIRAFRQRLRQRVQTLQTHWPTMTVFVER